jgi:5-methylcytosine-specific restriction endonuclease McrA
MITKGSVCVNNSCSDHGPIYAKNWARNFFTSIKLGKTEAILDLQRGHKLNSEQNLSGNKGSPMMIPSNEWVNSLIKKIKQSSRTKLNGMIDDYRHCNNILDELRQFLLMLVKDYIKRFEYKSQKEVLDWLNSQVDQVMDKPTFNGYDIWGVPSNLKNELLNCQICKLQKQERYEYYLKYKHNDQQKPFKLTMVGPKKRTSIQHIMETHPEIALYFGDFLSDSGDTWKLVIYYIDYDLNFDKSKSSMKEKRKIIKKEKLLKKKIPKIPKNNHNKNQARQKTSYSVIKNNILKLDTLNHDPIIKTTEVTSYARPQGIIRNLKKLHKKCMICQVVHFKQANGERYSEGCHIIPNNHSHNNKSNNLIILCPTCHKKFDLGIIKDRIIMYEQLKQNYPTMNFSKPDWYK